jgi:hypothetical protein
VIIRTALSAACAIALSACYTSDTLLLNASAGVQPLPDGVYANGKGDFHRLSRTSDGWYLDQIKAGDDKDFGAGERLLLNAIGTDGGKPLYAFAKEEKEIGYVYGVVEVENGRFYRALPDCTDENDRASAVANGGRYTGGDDGTCAFTSASGLIAALRAYIAAGGTSKDFERPFERTGG